MIRKELAIDSINSLEKVTCELNSFLWTSIDKIIAWIRKRLWNLPEIRREMIGEDEIIENKLLQHSFDALIQRLGRPATDIFLRFPRSRVERIKVMQEFQMELLILDKFIVDGRMCDRGIIRFLANGKHGEFLMDVKSESMVIEDQNEKDGEEKASANRRRPPPPPPTPSAPPSHNQARRNTNEPFNRNNDSVSVYSGDLRANNQQNYHNQPNARKVYESNDTFVQVDKSEMYIDPDNSRATLSQVTVKKEKKSVFSLNPFKDKKGNTAGLGSGAYNVEGDTSSLDGSINGEYQASSTPLALPYAASDNDMTANLRLIDPKSQKKVQVHALRASDTQFAKLKFSEDSENLGEIQHEIEQDVREFILCMKNSVFYGSGIQRFYNQELDKLRRKFIELEESKRHWSFHVFNYIKRKDGKVSIPAPKMSDEIASRSRMVKTLKEVHVLVNDFEF
jgi:hypothetical protein